MRIKHLLPYKRPEIYERRIKLNFFFNFPEETAFTQFSQGEGVLLAQGCCGTCFSCSDRRLKQHIQPIVSVLDKLKTVKSVSFEWNKRYKNLFGVKTHTHEIGVIAQDLEKVFPSLVRHFRKEKYRMVNYKSLTAVLLQAVKELDVRNNLLERRLQKLESR